MRIRYLMLILSVFFIISTCHADSRITLELKPISTNNMYGELSVELYPSEIIRKHEMFFYNVTFSDVKVNRLGLISTEELNYELLDSKIVVFFPKDIQPKEKISYVVKANFINIIKQINGSNIVKFSFLNNEGLTNFSVRISLPKDYEIGNISPSNYKLKIENDIIIDFFEHLDKNELFSIQIEFKRKSNTIVLVLQAVFLILLFFLLNLFLYKFRDKMKKIKITTLKDSIKKLEQKITKAQTTREEVIREFEQRIDEIKIKKEEVQKEFYAGKIEEETFNEMMRDYEKQIIELKAKINLLKEK
jgi:hypothetical protein